MTAYKEAILVGVRLDADKRRFEESLNELSHLVNTLNISTSKIITQRRTAPNPATYIGKGKVEELAELVKRGANIIIFNNELSSSQMYKLEKLTKAKVIDRTGVILEIFTRHAYSKEAKLQTQVAKLKYLLAHLVGKGKELSRLGGGISTRGPGEMELEYDRRMIKERLKKKEEELKKIIKLREEQRKLRIKKALPKIAIVGYTNTGKSTLFNALSSADVKTKDELFTTLDAITRRIYIGEDKKIVLLTDTIGFIQDLPPQLIHAFYATLEEVKLADILIHVVDITSKYMIEKINVVYSVLEQLSAKDKITITAFNKIDLIDDNYKEYTYKLVRRYDYPEPVFISAAKKINLDKLKSILKKYI